MTRTILDRMEAALALAIASGHTIDDAVLIVAALENSDVFLVKITPIEHHEGSGLGELLSLEEGHKRLVQYRSGQQRGETVRRQMPEGFNLAAWMRDPKNAPEPHDHDAFKAGYWSVIHE